MDHTLFIILGTVAIYAALFVYVAFSPKFSQRLIFAAGAVSIVCGLIFYGMCFAAVCDNTILAILKTCQAVCLLFVGQGSMDAIAGAPMLQYVIVQIVFSSLSFLGVFTTAGAAITAIGASFLRKLRLYLQRVAHLAIIRPLTPQTLAFARELADKKDYAVVFVDSNPDKTCVDAAHQFCGVIRSDEDALSGKEAFIRSLNFRITKRKISLFALSDDQFANRQFACRLAGALQQCQVPASQTALTIFANEDQTQNTIFSPDGSYSFGSILCISQEQMAARLLMHKSAPWDTISFDENAKATENFEALIIGSGKVGQAVIKQLVMNGQFVGSRFRLTVFDPKFSSISGQLCHESRQIFQHYHIDVRNMDGRSNEMYDFLEENIHKLKYLVVCTGNDTVNREIARQLSNFLSAHHCSLPIHICSRRGLQRFTANQVERWDIFARQVLCSDEMDAPAMLLNHYYCCNDKTIQENWAQCDYFSRMSSRASADFAPAFVKMAGVSANTLSDGQWCTKEQLENMAITEHERWCAFHYCMGFRNMMPVEYKERCRIYREEKVKNPKTRYRIGKDLDQRIHACLIPWSQLDNLSKKENQVIWECLTGEELEEIKKDPKKWEKIKKDYKEEDRKNVRALPGVLNLIQE